MITRKQYLNGEATHRAYYAQFVTPEMKANLLKNIPESEILKTKDKENFNSIPLAKWDALSGIYFVAHGRRAGNVTLYGRLIDKITKAGEGITPATLVCIYKEIAKQIVESQGK